MRDAGMSYGANSKDAAVGLVVQPRHHRDDRPRSPGLGTERDVVISNMPFGHQNFSLSFTPANHGNISRLVRGAAFNANFPCRTGTSFVARIFSMTRSIK
jgi:hypothetical protein